MSCCWWTAINHHTTPRHSTILHARFSLQPPNAMGGQPTVHTPGSTNWHTQSAFMAHAQSSTNPHPAALSAAFSLKHPPLHQRVLYLTKCQELNVKKPNSQLMKQLEQVLNCKVCVVGSMSWRPRRAAWAWLHGWLPFMKGPNRVSQVTASVSRWGAVSLTCS